MGNKNSFGGISIILLEASIEKIGTAEDLFVSQSRSIAVVLVIEFCLMRR